MIAHVSPAAVHKEESRNTLLYADRAKSISNKASSVQHCCLETTQVMPNYSKQDNSMQNMYYLVQVKKVCHTD
jgi:hypothetical protein